MRHPESPNKAVASLRHEHPLRNWLRRAAVPVLLCGLQTPGWSQEQPLPLIENIRDLHCAADESAATSALQRLKSNLDQRTGLPDEWEGTQRDQQLHAGTLDLAIETTVRQINKFPSLTPLAESVLLQWDYCEVFHDGVTYDLHSEDSELKKDRADYAPPSNWNGMAMLGLGHTGASRYIPEAFSNTATTARSKVLYNWWNLQRHQCLPHPGNGQMFHRKQYVARARVNTATPTTLNTYPLAWSNDCSVPFTTEEHKQEALRLAREKALRLAEMRAALLKILAQHQNREHAHYLSYKRHMQRMKALAHHAKGKAASTAITFEQFKRASVVVSPVKMFSAVKPVYASSQSNDGLTIGNTQQSNNETVEQNVTADNTRTAPATAPDNPSYQLTAEEAARNARELEKRIAIYRGQIRRKDKGNPDEAIVTPEPVTTKTTTPENREPGLAAATPASNEPTNPISYQSAGVPPFETTKSTKDRKYHGLSGSFALSNRSFEPDAWSLTANFNYKPIIDSYFFARSGFTFTESDDPVSYYWGIGYNDWHTDTWAFELNNWGPLTPGDGLKVEKAIASLSYKFDSSLLTKFNLSSSLTLSAGKDSSPSLTLATTWSPKANWFIRNLITQSLDGGDATWAYGFGYNNWRSNTWSLEYNNWGPNTLSAPNFKDNALITLSWKWNL